MDKSKVEKMKNYDKLLRMMEDFLNEELEDQGFKKVRFQYTFEQ